LGIDAHRARVSRMEILIGGGNGDPAKMQFFFSGHDFLGGRLLSWIDTSKADQLLREAVDVFSNVLVWNLRLKVAALKPKHDGLIHGCALSQVMVRIGGWH